MELINLATLKRNRKLLLSLPMLTGYFLLARFAVGVHYGLIYAFIAGLFLLRVSFEKIALIFLSLCIVTYIFGRDTEANHYLSFVFGFLFLTLLKYLYVIVRERFSK